MKHFLSTLLALLTICPQAWADRTFTAGSTDKSSYVRIIDSVTGAPETGVTSATSGLDLEYVRAGAAPVDLTESNLGSTSAAHSDGGLIHVGGGRYRVDLPDAAIAAGVQSVDVQGTITDMIVIPETIMLTTFDLQAANPNVNANQIGGATPPDLSAMDSDLTDVKNVTDGFIGIPVASGSPAAAGSPAIAKQILEGERATICYLGDSITHDLLATVNRWWAGRCGIKGFGTYSRFNVIGTQSGVFTGDDTPDDWTDLDIGGGHWGKSTFGSGTSNASSTSSTNVIFAGRVGPPTGSSSINDGADWMPRSQRHALGFNWMNAVLATGDLKVRAAIRKTPNGAVGEHQYFVFKDGSTVRATSSFVSSYAASPTVEWVEATIPQGTTLTGGLTIEVRYRASTAGENTKETFWSSRFEVYDPAATTGSLVHSFAQSSTSIDDWNDTFSSEAASIFSVIQPDVLFIQLGTNNPSSYDATEFAAEIATLVAKIRAHSPDTTIVFVSIYGDPDVNEDFGGELGDEPYHTDGYFQAYQATSNSLFVNLGKLLPRAGSLVEPYPLQTAYPAWSDLTTGDFIQWHSIVEYGGNWYACKVGHAKGATNPSADTTNWVQLGVANSINQWQLNITNQNPMFRDGLHPHLGGAYLMCQGLIDGLQIIRYSTTQQTIAMSVHAELAGDFGDLNTDVDTVIANVDAANSTLATMGPKIDATQAATDKLDLMIDDSNPSAPKYTEPALAEAPSGGGGGDPVAADVVDDSRTWFATDYRARNIISVAVGYEGPLAMQPDLNPGTTIIETISVEIIGPVVDEEPTEVTATTFTVNRGKTRAHCSVPELTVPGTYEVTWVVKTVDTPALPTTATLKVQ